MTINTIKQAARHVICQRMIKRADISKEIAKAEKQLKELGIE